MCRRAAIRNGGRSSPTSWPRIGPSCGIRWNLIFGRPSRAKTEKSTDSFNVNVLATSRLWISQVWRDCRRSGLDCWAIDGLPLAMARTVGLAGGLAGGQRALVVDWGYSNTTLCIAGDDRPLYSRRIHDCAFGRVLDAIMNGLDVTLDEAQHLVEQRRRCRRATANRPATRKLRKAITSAAAGTLDELVRQIGRTLQFTEMQRRHLQPAAVWLMGGGASMKNIGPYLAEALSLPVHIWSLAPEAEPIECAAGNRAAVFGSAAALSSLGMEGSMRTMINLLPQSFRRQQILRKRLMQWTSIISAVLVTGWGWHWYEMREDRQLTQQLETLSREHAPTQTMLKQLVEMRQQLKELQQQETVAKELDCQRNALTLLGVISDTAQKTKGRLRVTKFELSNFQDAQPAAEPRRGEDRRV